jgi:hypothetical protein
MTEKDGLEREVVVVLTSDAARAQIIDIRTAARVVTRV